MNYTYIVKCSDDTLYTGWTNDLERRIRMHNEKKGAKYTKTRLPVSLVYYETFETKQEAQKREYQIKQMTRIQKLALIQAKTSILEIIPETVPEIVLETIPETMPDTDTCRSDDRSCRP